MKLSIKCRMLVKREMVVIESLLARRNMIRRRRILKLELWKVDKVLKKVTSKDSKKYYRGIGKNEEFQMVGIGDASFGESRLYRVSLIYLKTKETRSFLQQSNTYEHCMN